VHGFGNCKIRGLCAENLTSVILSSSNEKRRQLLERFQTEIRFWLREEDCWVIEHMYRLFSTLDRKRFDFNWLLPEGASRLFGDRADWYRMPREQFLRHIEERKLALASAPASASVA
jgi:hypothetical protein